MVYRRTYRPFQSRPDTVGYSRSSPDTQRGREAGMNLEILEEYIKQEWAPDFHYAHYETIPWTPLRKASDAACVALVTTGGVHLRQDPPFAGIDDASYREIPGTAQAGDLTASHPFFDTAELEQDLFYVFLIVMPITGWLVVSSGGRPVTSYFGLFDIAPLPVSRTEDVHEWFEEVHKWLAYAGLALIALHVAGALKHHFDGHRHLIGRMAPWAWRGEPRLLKPSKTFIHLT